MKLAYVTSRLSNAGGGVSAAVEALSRRIDSPKLQVSVLGLADSDWANERESWHGAQAETFPVIGPRSLGLSPQLRRALLALDPDITHAHGIWTHTSADVLAWAGGKKPYIVSPHGMLDPWAVANSGHKKRIARLLYEDRHLRGATCIHALCTAEARAIRTSELKNPICVIPNGVDLPAADSRPPALWSSIEVRPKTLLFLGRLHSKKNVHGLLRALARIKAGGGLGDWRLVVAGWNQGGYGAELAALTSELALRSKVVFLGPVHGAKKDAALRNASAFILPSLSEGLPMAVLEAWAYSLPVAMTPECNLPEGYAAGAAHEISTDAEKMASDLAEFLSLNEAEHNAMGLRGLELVRTRFSWESTATCFAAVYEWMLGGNPPECVLR